MAKDGFVFFKGGYRRNPPQLPVGRDRIMRREAVSLLILPHCTK